MKKSLVLFGAMLFSLTGCNQNSTKPLPELLDNIAFSLVSKNYLADAYIESGIVEDDNYLPKARAMNRLSFNGEGNLLSRKMNLKDKEELAGEETLYYVEDDGFDFYFFNYEIEDDTAILINDYHKETGAISEFLYNLRQSLFTLEQYHNDITKDKKAYTFDYYEKDVSVKHNITFTLEKNFIKSFDAYIVSLAFKQYHHLHMDVIELNKVSFKVPTLKCLDLQLLHCLTERKMDQSCVVSFDYKVNLAPINGSDPLILEYRLDWNLINDSYMVTVDDIIEYYQEETIEEVTHYYRYHNDGEKWVKDENQSAFENSVDLVLNNYNRVFNFNDVDIINQVGDNYINEENGFTYYVDIEEQPFYIDATFNEDGFYLTKLTGDGTNFMQVGNTDPIECDCHISIELLYDAIEVFQLPL